MSENATIFALSSAPGRAAVAVIRVSGPAAGRALEALAGRVPEPRTAAPRTLRVPGSRDVIDQALVLFFKAPRSETGEDLAELQVHGGRAVIHAVLEALGRIPGCRLAEPGEFSRRAFLNGKMDLTAVEGLADLIDAETEAQRRQAVRQAGGALSKLYEGWRGRLLEAIAHVEAAIDFSDEGDVGTEAHRAAVGLAAALAADVRAHLDDGHRGEILREGFQVVLAGPPNVGKSSLLNALTRREAAIVSDEAGTTRDVIEVRLDLEGLPVVISDTAGLRAATGAVEREGIRRTLARSRTADLVVWLMDATAPAPALPSELVDRGGSTLRVANKADLVPAGSAVRFPEGTLAISAMTGEGIDGLTRRLAALAREAIGSSEHPALTQARHRANLMACLAALDAFAQGRAEELELRADDLRQAASALGRLTGRIDAEEVLGQIFGRFCIGK
jgi:tRNA modification GTPase